MRGAWWIVGAAGVVAGCSSNPETCNGSRYSPEPATLDLACAPTDLASVVLTGSCASNKTDPGLYVGGSPPNEYVTVPTPTSSPGLCHVELQFANGYMFSTDIQFSSKNFGDQQCPDNAIVASPQTVMVNNPSATCVDGGGEAGAGG